MRCILLLMIPMLALLFVSCVGKSPDKPDVVPYWKDGKQVYSDDPERDGLVFRTR